MKMKRMKRYTESWMICCLVAMVLTACSSDESVENTHGGDQPIQLSAQIESATTRSGQTGSMDYSVLATTGFGVYSPANDNWAAWENRKVEYNGPTSPENPGSIFAYPGSWSYTGSTFTPLYWKANANGGPIDFYAYAPYEVSPSGTTGITALDNIATDNPEVSYTIATEPQNAVDLLWGVNGMTGLPWTKTTYDATGDGKQPTGGPVLMTFHHALAAIGFRVQTMIDKTNDLDDPTDQSDVEGVLGTDYKLTIKKIEIVGDFHPEGELNLHNTVARTANWSHKTTAESMTLTVPNGQITAAMKHTAANETTTTSEEAETIITTDAITGVTQTPQQLVIAYNASGKEQLLMVIPSEARTYTLKVYWCLNRRLPNGTTYAAEDHNTTSIDISSIALEAGVKYYFDLVFNLKTVKIEVSAEDWETGVPVNVEVQIEHGTSASESLAPQRR